MELVKYDAACQAVAALRTIDEGKHFIDKAVAAQAYARQAKNRQLEIDACEIRIRAERRLGEIILTLKDGHVLVGGRQPPGAEQKRLTLTDVGIDGRLSAGAQRLASLPLERFEAEIVNWREAAPMQRLLETPLQRYRHPSSSGDRQKAAARHYKPRIDSADPFDRFRAPDGRRIVDWRIGELRRQADLFRRAQLLAETFASELPIDACDPLATLEMVLDHGSLRVRLEEAFREVKIDPADAGLNGPRFKASRERRSRDCEHCGTQFVARNPSGKARAGRSNEGRFCSRPCAAAHQSEVRRHGRREPEAEIQPRR